MYFVTIASALFSAAALAAPRPISPPASIDPIMEQIQIQPRAPTPRDPPQRADSLLAPPPRTQARPNTNSIGIREEVQISQARFLKFPGDWHYLDNIELRLQVVPILAQGSASAPVPISTLCKAESLSKDKRQPLRASCTNPDFTVTFGLRSGHGVYRSMKIEYKDSRGGRRYYVGTVFPDYTCSILPGHSLRGTEVGNEPLAPLYPSSCLLSRFFLFQLCMYVCIYGNLD